MRKLPSHAWLEMATTRCLERSTFREDFRRDSRSVPCAGWLMAEQGWCWYGTGCPLPTSPWTLLF